MPNARDLKSQRFGRLVVWQRIYRSHWSIERALTEPVRRVKYAS